MKKILFTLFVSIGLITTSLKGMDSSLLCVKDHESTILNDHEWHTLKFFNDVSGFGHVTAIGIKQKNTGVDYVFKSASRDAMLDFYYWLTYQSCYPFEYDINEEEVSMEKVKDGYVGSFNSKLFVPYIDARVTFLGIDVF